MKLFQFLIYFLFHYFKIYFFKPLGLGGYLHTPGLHRKSAIFHLASNLKRALRKRLFTHAAEAYVSRIFPPTVESVMRVPNTVLAIVLWMKKFRAVTRRWRRGRYRCNKGNKWLPMSRGGRWRTIQWCIKATILGISYRYMYMH